METPSPQTLKTCLSKSTKLQTILNKARELTYLNSLLHNALPEDALQQHCHLVNWENGRLTVAASSSAWAFRLRFHHQRLLKELQSLLPGLNEIRYIILPPEQPAKPTSRETQHISASAKTMIEQFANSISDEKLKQSLSRLAR